MKSLADGLPPEIAQQIHPDWRKNEADYWAVRDQLLSQYEGQWIGFADGAVIVAASTPTDVFHVVRQSARHAFMICVGYEDEPWYRIRRTTFPYDTAYSGAALPVLSAEFRAVTMGFLNLGLVGWSRISLPASSGFRGSGADSGAGCAQPLGDSVSRSDRRSRRQSVSHLNRFSPNPPPPVRSQTLRDQSRPAGAGRRTAHS